MIECNLIIEHDLSIKYDFVVDLTNSKPERLSSYSPGNTPGLNVLCILRPVRAKG